jgi:iron complex transport system substrate-binding protein
MNHPPRIVSLLPGLTDTVLALGKGRSLVGISHECDLPAGWPELPRLTSCRIHDQATSFEIDEQVRDPLSGDLFELDVQVLKELKPDIILTQSQCDVCAVSQTTVEQAAWALEQKPKILAVNPTNMSTIFGMIREVGQLLEDRRAAETVVRTFEEFELALDSRKACKSPLNVVHLEWLDPVMGSGHWNPELIRMVGGQERTALPGSNSKILTQHLIEEAFESCKRVVLGVCGFTVERSLHELNLLPFDHILQTTFKQCGARIYVVDGHRHLVRPGPILISTLSILAKIMGGFEDVVLPSQVNDLDLTIQSQDFSEIIHSTGRWIIRS